MRKGNVKEPDKMGARPRDWPSSSGGARGACARFGRAGLALFDLTADFR